MKIDGRTGRPTTEAPVTSGYVAGFISWERLLKVLRAQGEFRNDEEVTMLDLQDTGISYRVVRKL